MLDLSSFNIRTAPSCLLKTSHGIDINPQALQQKAPELAEVMASVTNTPDAGHLLLGLNELFGSASDYAITGSAALALHQHLAGLGATARRPNDIDVVVGQSGLQRLYSIDFEGAAKLGFGCGPQEKAKLNWKGPNNSTLTVDVISSTNRAAGRGFIEAVPTAGVRVVPLSVLKNNLLKRAEDGLAGPHQAQDLESIHQLETLV